ncbi:ATP-dependent DNA ligase [Eleftheria terrae]|uniref:ATP-dependent DNA ligase n=1 Tax=Eleftheria terrae TaxID=1597781 RepID=UPI00263ABEC6|nr:ATP-dependent DNA ligase [Eleftheria terrae]WKB52176.1 ATP-dependent DNA ligase [Eleftheria terrae]
MEAFARLYAELDASTRTLDKVAALRRYFSEAAPADAAWAVYFLAGGRPRQLIPTRQLRALACEVAGIDDWLFEESYQAVGDLAETIAHVLPPATGLTGVGLAEWVEQRLLPLRGLAPEVQAERIRSYWQELDWAGRFLLAKLIGGGFRVGVSRLLVTRALAEHAGLDPKVVAQRMMGFTAMVADGSARPDATRYAALLSQEDAAGGGDAGQPYPFFLAHQVELPLARFEERLGRPSDWLVEWKYDGIRGQLVKRRGEVWLWSRGEELVTDRFPEVVALACELPDGTVLDGEVVVWKDGRPAPFALLQQRIGRKTLTKKVLAEAPASFIAYDVLEWQGQDVRGQPQWQRRELLQAMSLPLSPLVEAADWAALAALREQSRERGVEGFMLKHRQAAYGVGRTKADGTWWKWKIDPMSVDAVLIYAQRGHGRRASLYTDYTFAVWSRPPANAAEAQQVVDAIERREPPEAGGLQLVPFAKAYSGLTDEEFRRIDAVIRRTTLEKFGPVRSLKPTLVFELGFEGINRSGRHKSGIAVRFPRMLRIRDDKPLHEADTLQSLEALLAL